MVDSVQIGVDAVGALIFGVGAWALNVVRSDTKDLRSAVDALLHGLPETYARRDDVKDGMARVETKQNTIDAKIDKLLQRHA